MSFNHYNLSQQITYMHITRVIYIVYYVDKDDHILAKIKKIITLTTRRSRVKLVFFFILVVVIVAEFFVYLLFNVQKYLKVSVIHTQIYTCTF